MSHENAPATKLLATNCACCGRALVDAVSVETGVGPDCREMHGFNEAQGEADWETAMALLDGFVSVRDVNPEMSPRDAVNKLVHLVARRATKLDREVARSIFSAIHALGFEVLAERIAKRFHDAVLVPAKEDVAALRTEYKKIRAAFCYDNCRPEAFDAIVRAMGPKTPTQWVERAKVATCPCGRCGGTGRFVTRVENGRPTGPGGDCYRCEGKGRQSLADAHRNRAYDLNNIRGAA